MVLFFLGYGSLSKGYNVLNEFMFQSIMRFCRMQWLPTRFYGSLSVYSRPLPSEKIVPWQPSYKTPFGDSCYCLIHDLLSYFMGEMLTNFVAKRMRDRPETDRFSDYVLSVLKAILLEILRVILS